MNQIDPKAPQIKGPQMLYNWKRIDFKGFTPPADIPLEETEAGDE